MDAFQPKFINLGRESLLEIPEKVLCIAKIQVTHRQLDCQTLELTDSKKSSLT